MCRRAALLALLLVALPSVTRASPTVHNFSLLSNWSASHDLPFATAYASVILHNGSLAISGGCVDVTCETITNRTIGYDPVAQVEYPLPELNFPIAGRHSTVSLSGSLVAVHMCGMVPYAFTPSHDVLNMVEVYNPGDASFSIISLTADQRRNITRANATCIGFKSFVYIFGGVDMKTSKFLDQMMALDMSVAGQITVYIHTLPDIGAYSLMTGYSDNFAMYLAGGVASLTDPLPQRSVFAIVPSGSSSNPLVGSCRTKMDSRIPFDASLTYLEPTEFQMVGYADWFVVKIGEFFATNINIKTCDAALCNSPNWTIISNPPTNYPESPYLPVAGTRRGASLVGIPLWQAGSNGPSTLSLWQFGGIAELNVTQFHTFPPTTLPPPTTTTTTVAPTTTTVAPPTTPAPNTTTSAPEPPKGVNQHLWDLMNVIWASDSTTEVPAAPGSNSGSGSEPGTPAATYATHWIETAVVGNLTHILTNLALPGLSVQDLNVPLGPVKPFNFSLTCPANETECDFYNSFCFAGQEGFDVCNVGLFSDPECYTSIKSHFLSGEEDVSMTLDNAGLGVRIWACFSYGTKSMSCGNQQPAYSVINFLDPLVTVSSQMTLAPPPTKAPASGQNYLLVAMAALAAVLLVALVGAVVWFKKRQRTAESAVAGRYINMEEIGRGAFGRVIKVKRISDDEVFAMKHIDCPSAEVLQEALKEFELLRKLQAHPNIIRVIDMFLNYEVVEGATGSHDGAFRRESNMRNSSSHTAVVVAPARHLCIVMDYHPSKDLKLWALGFATAIPECILCHIAVQTCSVLSFIHERNVIHRDLKPENILIVKDDRDQPGTRTSRVSQAALQPVVITDFGLAHFVAESRTVGFVGTAVYSAPECVALLLPNRQQLGLPPAAAAAAPSTQPRTVAYNDPAAPLLQSRNEPTLSYTAGINAPTPRSAAITRSGRAGSKGTGHTVSAQCDIWSLGCVLYAAATKRMERSNVRKMFEDVNSPTFVADITADLRNAGYSPAFAAFVLRLLKLEPEERPTAKDALKYFRKSNRDQSYHVTETQKLTAEERKRAKMPMAAPPAPSINRLSGSTTTPPSTRPSSKRAIDSPPTTASKAPPVPAQEGLVVPPPRAQYRTAEDTAAPPPAAPTREPSRLRENSVDRGSSPRVVVVGSPQGSKRAAPRSSSDGERESLRTRDTPRTPSPTVQAGTARGHNGVGATVVVSSGEEDKILAEYSDRDD